MSLTVRWWAYTLSLAACTVLCACTHPGPAPNPPPPSQIVLVGDSTVSAYGPERYPRMGWGMVLGCGLRADISVVNLAASGRSTKSFIAEGRWQSALDALRGGDVVLIQFGHNDQKLEDPQRYTAPDGAFRDNLAVMIDSARSKGAIPVLLTPVARRRFVAGLAQDTHAAYADAVRRVAQERNVALVDLSADSLALLAQEGEARSRALYLHFSPNDGVRAYPDGVADDTHFSEAGARAMARLVVQRLAQSGLPLARSVQPDATSLAPGFVVGGPGCAKEHP